MASKPRRSRRDDHYRRENLDEESRHRALRAAAMVLVLAALLGLATWLRPRPSAETAPETEVTSETSPDPASPQVAEAPAETTPEAAPTETETAAPTTPSIGPNTVMAPTDSAEIERRNREVVTTRQVEVPVPAPTPRVTYGVRQPAWPEPVYGGTVTTPGPTVVVPGPAYRVRSAPGTWSGPTASRSTTTYGYRRGVTHHSYGTTRSSGHYRSGGTTRYTTRTVTVRRR